MSYTTESGVYARTGFNTSTIQTITGKNVSEVSALIEGFIDDAEAEIRETIGYPLVITEERHLGNGSKNIFDLGPEDDPFATEGDYDPEDGVVEVYDVYFGGAKKLKPYPESADLWTEPSADTPADWTGSNATISRESTIIKAGTYSIKAVFSAAGYVQYPDDNYLDVFVDPYKDFCLWIRTTNINVGITVRIYDVDGNYAEETITLRQNDVGQYVFLDLDSFDTVLDWDDVRVQYIRIYVDGACTLYIDNMCFVDDWTFSAPEGKFIVSVADNITGETSGPSYGYPFFVSYSYDPFLASVPRYIKGATECLAGIYLINHMRGTKYQETDFEIWNESLEADTPFQRGGMLGVISRLEKEYERFMSRWSIGGSYGVI